VLGDRPIEITLQRAWDALNWRQRVQLGAELADGLLSVQQVRCLWPWGMQLGTSDGSLLRCCARCCCYRCTKAGDTFPKPNTP